MNKLRTIRENVFLLLFFWGEATADEVCAILDYPKIQVLAALYVLEAIGKVSLDGDHWTAEK